MQCPQCQANVSSSALFCPNCGNALTAASAPTAPASSPAQPTPGDSQEVLPLQVDSPEEFYHPGSQAGQNIKENLNKALSGAAPLTDALIAETINSGSAIKEAVTDLSPITEDLLAEALVSSTNFKDAVEQVTTAPSAAKAPDERTIMQSLGSLLYTAANLENGRLELTDRRLIFYRSKKTKSFLVNFLTMLTPPVFDFDIYYRDIAEVSEGRVGMRTSLIIKTKQGEERSFFVNQHQNQWKNFLANIVKRLHTPS